jgi:GNAT superfamily N-acetyltransferase
MPADQVVLRPAISADIEAAARCHLACWREAYAGLIADDLLTAITRDLEWAIGVWRRMLDSDQTTTLAVDGDVIVGFATTRPTPEPGLDIALHLNAINLRRAYWRSDVGQKLLDAAIASLWVFRDNARARAFYARNGFTSDGAEQVEDFFGGLVEVRMVRRC